MPLFSTVVPPEEKYALLIGIEYDDEEWKLFLPHQDVDAMKKMLISDFGYPPNNIILMKDSPDVPSHLRPTKENLEREMKLFIRQGQENVEYFFHYCGHSGQQEVRPGDKSEEDNMDEYIITLDKDRILDNELHDWLVKPVLALKTTRLSAVLDTCHSGTLFDLFHCRCNRVCRPSSRFRRSIRRVNEVIESFFRPDDVVPVFDPLIKMGAVLTSLGMPPLMQCSKVWSEQGLCRHCPRPKDMAARIVCISACKDGERTFEGAHGHSMTMDIIDLLRKDKNQSLKQLIRGIDRRCHEQNKQMAREARHRNYQHPQISTDIPARMSSAVFLALPS